MTWWVMSLMAPVCGPKTFSRVEFWGDRSVDPKSSSQSWQRLKARCMEGIRAERRKTS